MPAYIPNIIEHTTFTSTYPACIYTILPAAAVKPIIKELVAVAAFIGISEIKFIPGIIIAPPPAPLKPENTPEKTLNKKLYPVFTGLYLTISPVALSLYSP